MRSICIRLSRSSFGGERGFALEKPRYEVIRRVYEANGVECTELAMGGGR